MYVLEFRTATDIKLGCDVRYVKRKLRLSVCAGGSRI